MKKIALFQIIMWACLGSSFAATPEPASDKAFDAASQALDKTKGEVQRLKDAWDKARLETTLYDQRAKRAYSRWVKAAKKTKEQAKVQKEKSELELQLAIEKRKLAWNDWQAALFRQASHEAQIKALDQEKEKAAVKERIKKLETKLNSSPAGKTN